jgi:hypothetical protein
MNAQFNEKFSEYLIKKSYIFIPTREKYDQMIAAVMKRVNGEKADNKQERNWMSR